MVVFPLLPPHLVSKIVIMTKPEKQLEGMLLSVHHFRPRFGPVP
jgi:hypothetical protein